MPTNDYPKSLSANHVLSLFCVGWALGGKPNSVNFSGILAFLFNGLRRCTRNCSFPMEWNQDSVELVRVPPQLEVKRKRPAVRFFCVWALRFATGRSRQNQYHLHCPTPQASLLGCGIRLSLNSECSTKIQASSTPCQRNA